MKRFRILLPVAVLVLAACGVQEPAPAPGESAKIKTPTQAALRLSGSGLALGADTAAFGSAREAAEHMATRHLSASPELFDSDECGAGPMAFSRYPGGLMLNFQDGMLVGWFLAEANNRVSLGNGLAVGSAQRVVEALPGFELDPESTLGLEFYSEADGVGGFIKDGKIVGLYAGVNCFLR